MAVNERLVLSFVVEEVTGRRLSNGIPTNGPSCNVELSASPPCRLLDRVTRSITERHSTQTNAYLGQPMHQPVITEREPPNQSLQKDGGGRTNHTVWEEINRR